MRYELDQFDPGTVAAAAARIAPLVSRTPLVRLDHDGPVEIWLKLENLQPIRSFKLRGAANALLSLPSAALVDGVWCARAGNKAQGAAYCARRLGVRCTVVVPEGAPERKLAAIERLEAEIVTVPFDDWFRIYETRTYPGMAGHFMHAFSDPDVMAGNATIGLELTEDLDDFDAVVIPYGGGGLACGIAAVLHHLRPQTVCYAAEVETAAPLAAAFAAGAPVPIEHRRTFIDGIGGPVLFPEMWEFASRLLAGSLASGVAEIAAAVRLLAAATAVVAEGAGAAPVAAAVGGGVAARSGAPARRIVCVVSGGNIDAGVLAEILRDGSRESTDGSADPITP